MYPNLKLQIWRSGIRQQQLAKMLGLHETVLSKIVNGSRVPSPQMKSKIAAALNADPAWLFENAIGAAASQSPPAPPEPETKPSSPAAPDEDQTEK
jgi:transcriptional regulator with XRE-family HTH domain